MSRTLAYEGSVKKLWLKNDHELEFEFTDRFSVFDWGQMPDEIPHKGKYLCEIAVNVFKQLEHAKIRTHFIRQSSDHEFVATKVNVYRPEHRVLKDRDVYTYPTAYNANEAYLIPLEVVYRFGVPVGSSLLERRKDLKVGDRLNPALVEYYTKLERTDRLLSLDEAKAITLLTSRELETLNEQTIFIAKELKTLFEEFDLELFDGKFEWAKDHKGFILVDSVGPDEMRITDKKTKVSFSKEFLRQFYKKTPWYEVLQSEKAQGGDFKARMKQRKLHPPRLPKEWIEATEAIYASLAAVVTKSKDASGLLQSARERCEQCLKH